ncbi:MAG: O-antigen ligase family protein [bacterium]
MQSIITLTLYLLSIFIPLTFTTINSELFEFPKFILLLSGTLVILLAWAIHIYQTHDYKFISSHNSPIVYSIIAILVAQTLATIFSIHPYTSFWGYYSRFHQGLLTTIYYSVIYFAAIKWLDKKSTHKLIKITIGTSFFISLYAILEHFGVDKNLWIQDVQSRVFSTLGQPNWLAAYLIPNLFLTLYLSQINKNKNPYLLYIVCCTLFAALLFTKSRSGFLGFGLSYLTYWTLIMRQFSFSKIRSLFIHYSSFIILFAAVLGTPYTPPLSSYFTNTVPTISHIPQGTQLETGGTESGDIRKIVWTGALSLIKKYPLLGTGPETFAYTYYWIRPLAHNMTSEWDFLYNKAHNEYLNIAATSGLIGLVAYLYFHFAVFSASLTRIPKSKKVNQSEDGELRALYPVLGASIISFAITNFFGFSVIPVYLLMIIIAAIPSATSNNTIFLNPKSYILNPLFFIIPLILIYPARLYFADYVYARGKANLDAGQLDAAIPLLEKAVSYRPSLDLFHNALGEAYSMLAVNTGSSDNEATKAQANRYASLAIKQALTTRKLNVYHLNDYKSRAKIYLWLAALDPQYYANAKDELIRARELAPTDPKLAYNLGLVYTRVNDLGSAEQQLKDAISLRPIYPDPYYALTLLYEQTRQTDKIIPLLTDAKTNLATYSSQLKEKIDKYAP